MEPVLGSVLGWIEPHAVLLALVLPAVIRVVGHWLPEELFMVAVGVLAARRPPAEAAVLLGAVWTGHFLTDQVVYSLGRALMGRLSRWERIERRVVPVLARVQRSQGALWGLIPARVLPMGRGAWLLAAGGAGVPRLRFVLVDAVALVVHVGVWCGLGWLAEDGAQAALEAGRAAAFWAALAAAAAVGGVLAWRRLPGLERLRLRWQRGRSY